MMPQILQKKLLMMEKFHFCWGHNDVFQKSFEGIHSLPNADSALRKKLDAELKENGPNKLFDQLVKLNPTKAREISPNDKQRLVRAIEIELSQIIKTKTR